MNTTIPTDKQNETFLRGLVESHVHTRRIAYLLNSSSYNFTVSVPKLRIRKDFSQRRRYRDNGDLYVNGKRIELKRYQLSFSSMDSYPFKNILVDTVAVVEKADPKPFLFVITNKAFTHCLILRMATMRHWEVVEIWDSVKNCSAQRYTCIKELAHFCRLSSLPEKLVKLGV